MRTTSPTMDGVTSSRWVRKRVRPRSGGSALGAPARQSDHIAGLGRRRRLEAKLADDANDPLHQFDVVGEPAARILEIVFKPDADVSAQQ
jgi:hypothetical protein